MMIAASIFLILSLTASSFLISRKSVYSSLFKLSPLEKSFFFAFGLIAFADWIQLVYFYSLYASYRFDSRDQARLFGVGLLSGSVAAPLAGKFMLKKGTKAGCVLCCGAFVLSSLLSLSGNLELCMVGKIIGGVSQSLLYSSFETYFVYSLSASNQEKGMLPDCLTKLHLFQGVVATMAGVSASLGVSFLGYSIPVVVSIVCATGGARYIHTRWENIPVAEIHLKSLVGWSAFREFAQNPSNLAVLIVQVGMESSVATITLLWSPVSYLVSTDGKPPYGVMFSTLMMTSLFGCLLYSRLRHRHSNAEILFAGAGIALIALWSITTICLHCIQVEWMFFAALNLYALSCGLYFPAMSNLKAYLYPDKYRAAMMSAVRVPLNIMIFLLVLVCHNPEDAFKWCFYLVLSSLAASYFLSSRVLEGKKFALPA
ncbi:hypothetical protein HDV03_004524 [Kappamyces sp. JEL0829]|nr:hypothetical protein HDV03_004524 [Kappamyces sp. JEL0829]